MFFRIISSLVFLAFCTTAPAGSWWDDLEGEYLRPGNNGNWQTYTDAENYLSNEYNRTVDAGSSASLVLNSDAPNYKIDRYNPFLLANAGGNSVYFYDDGADLAKFRIGIDMPHYGPGNSEMTTFLGLGVNDNVEGDSTEYVTYHDNVITSTGLPRTIGWHRLQLSWSENATPLLMLDNVLMTADKNTTKTSRNASAIFQAEAFAISGASDTTGTKVWLDDLLGMSNVVPQSFMETFETTFTSSYWSDYSYSFSAELSGLQNHTPASTTSLSLWRSAGNTSFDNRVIAMPDNRGYVSAWFYDDGTSPTEFSIFVTSRIPGYAGYLSECSFALGVRDETTTSNGYQLLKTVGDSVTSASTGIERTLGWHKIEFGTYSDAPGLKVRLDGTDVDNGLMTDAGTITNFGMAGHMYNVNDTFSIIPVESEGGLFIDDLAYFFNEDLPDLPSTVEEWRLFE